MSTISTDDVRRLAQLSNLQLAESEVENLTTDLGEILTYIEQLSEIDTSGVEPTYQVTGLENVWREDIVLESSVAPEALVMLAPESEQNQVKVPKVL